MIEHQPHRAVPYATRLVQVLALTIAFLIIQTSQVTAQENQNASADSVTTVQPLRAQRLSTYNPAKPPKLNVIASSLDFTWHAIMTGTYAACAGDPGELKFFDYGTTNPRATCIAYTATHGIFAGLALWNIVASAREYRARHGNPDPVADLRWPRTAVAFSVLSSSYWLQELARGLVSKSTSGAEQTAGALIPAMFLVLHVPTLIVTVRDLRWRRETKDLYSEKSVRWTAGPGSLLVTF